MAPKGRRVASEAEWLRYFNIAQGVLPNVRLGMRGEPTSSDWKRYWEANAMEPVILADTLASRRRERRRLEKEWKLALQGCVLPTGRANARHTIL